MKIYLDTCCYGRPYDDKSRREVEDEANAVMTAVDVCQIVGHVIVGSAAVTFEIGKIRDADKRATIKAFYDKAVDVGTTMNNADFARAAEFQAQGMGVLDSHHLAAAEAAGVDALLTTDKDFLKISAQVKTPVKVINPLNFLPEATK